jgi:GntR family transcriptional regulator
VIRIDTSSFTPFYEQVKRQVKGQVASGTLAPGDPLPSIRDLALSLLLNPNTVARAYRELEREGLITTRKGKGCFVAADSARLARSVRTDEIERLLDEALEQASRQGLSGEDVKSLLSRREKLRGTHRQGRKKP